MSTIRFGSGREWVCRQSEGQDKHLGAWKSLQMLVKACERERRLGLSLAWSLGKLQDNSHWSRTIEFAAVRLRWLGWLRMRGRPRAEPVPLCAYSLCASEGKKPKCGRCDRSLRGWKLQINLLRVAQIEEQDVGSMKRELALLLRGRRELLFS